VQAEAAVVVILIVQVAEAQVEEVLLEYQELLELQTQVVAVVH
jgi:hypothetical protein